MIETVPAVFVLDDGVVAFRYLLQYDLTLVKKAKYGLCRGSGSAGNYSEFKLIMCNILRRVKRCAAKTWPENPSSPKKHGGGTISSKKDRAVKCPCERHFERNSKPHLNICGTLEGEDCHLTKVID